MKLTKNQLSRSQMKQVLGGGGGGSPAYCHNQGKGYVSCYMGDSTFITYYNICCNHWSDVTACPPNTASVGCITP